MGNNKFIDKNMNSNMIKSVLVLAAFTQIEST